jgi:hypothetical protein
MFIHVWWYSCCFLLFVTSFAQELRVRVPLLHMCPAEGDELRAARPQKDKVDRGLQPQVLAQRHPFMK